MSEELELLNEIREYLHGDVLAGVERRLHIIEAALKDYEAEHTSRIRLENANYTLTKEKDFAEQHYKELLADYKILKADFESLRNFKYNKLDAFEIIKEKNVNVRAFKKVLLMKQNDDVKLRAYNSQNDKDEDDLTKDEFNELKEVLI